MDNRETVFIGIGYEIHKITDSSSGVQCYQLFAVNFKTVKVTSSSYEYILEAYLKRLIEGSYLLLAMNNDKYEALQEERKRVEQEINRLRGK